ncbi:MAG TPA: histidine phosphatase family protein [Pseudolabrys sp.]|nr:histidine phosphatase family protein [Pseudolabrys sp.]
MVSAAKRPIVYYIRHGETDWNIAGRLQGRRDISLNARGRAQAAHCGDILRGLFGRGGRSATEFDFVSSPLGRARETMELVRATLGLTPEEFVIEPRLTEIAFGDWEGFTIAQLHSHDPQGIAAREQDKWRFVPPGGESYAAVSVRVSRWYEGLSRDTVAVAHGGTARGLIAHLGITKPAAAPLVDIAQGVVYLFDDGRLSRFD